LPRSCEDVSEEPSGTVDLDQVMGEIQEEVRRRRAAGDFPPSLERELDLEDERLEI